MVIMEWYVGVLTGRERELRPADFRGRSDKMFAVMLQVKLLCARRPEWK